MPGIRIERRTAVRRRGEQERLESGRLAEMAGALAGVGYWRFDLKTGETWWSDMMFEIYGRSPDDPTPDLEEVLSTHHADCRDEIDRQIREATTREPGSGGYTVEFDLRRADGSVRRVLGQGAMERGPDGQPVAMFGTTVDVTEQREAEKAVRDSEALYRLLAENATDLIGRIDLDGVTLYVTPSVEKVLGYPAAEMIGRKTLEFVHREDGAALVAAYRRVMAGGPPERIEYRFRRRDGDWVWVEACPVLVRDEQGRPKEFIDVARDITSRKALELELLAARREAEAAAEAKAQFLANMSHELRTPITAVLGFAELLAAREGLDPEARRYVDRIASGGRALLATVNDVLDFSKLEAGRLSIKPAPASPAAVASEALVLFEAQAHAKGLQVRLEASPDLPAWALVDPDRLRQVLLNLIGNAVKFTGQGGVTVRIDWDAGAHQATFSIIDTGAGIPADRLGQLFQRFSQVDGSAAGGHGGTGLGLAICKGLVEAMDGEIGASSREGQGSCFWFRLPMAPTAKPAQAADEDTVAPSSSVRVLVADDNAVNRELVRAILLPFGCDLVEAEDGDDAVRQASAQPFDVILMDIRMPRRDGRDAARAIRASGGINALTPIIAFSADGEAEVSFADAALFDGRLAKPLRPAELLRAIAVAAPEGDAAQPALARSA